MYDDWGSVSGSEVSSSRMSSSGAARIARGLRQRRARPIATHLVFQGRAWGLLSTDNAFRRQCYALATSRALELFMFAVIIANCAMMTLERPTLPSESLLGKILQWSDVGFTALFGIEMLVKMTAFTPLQYLKHLPSAVDATIVATSVLTLSLQAVAGKIQFVRALRVLRAIKPLRAITRSAGMQLVLRSILLVSLGPWSAHQPDLGNRAHAYPTLTRPNGSERFKQTTSKPQSPWQRTPLLAIPCPAVPGRHGQRLRHPRPLLRHFRHPGRVALLRQVLLLQRHVSRHACPVRGGLHRPQHRCAKRSTIAQGPCMHA